MNLTAQELAAIFKVHPATIRRLAKAGILPHTRVGRQFRFNQQDVWKALNIPQPKDASDV